MSVAATIGVAAAAATAALAALIFAVAYGNLMLDADDPTTQRGER